MARRSENTPAAFALRAIDAGAGAAAQASGALAVGLRHALDMLDVLSRRIA
jgi:hypothetical protein